MNSGYMNTVGVDYKVKFVSIGPSSINLLDERVALKLQIWDTAGQER